MTNTEKKNNETTHIVFNLCGISENELKYCSPAAYPVSYPSLQKASQLWQKGEDTWVEALADFQERQAECLLSDKQDGYEALAKAFSVCQWMSEESGYLPTTYPDNPEEMRRKLFARMDRLRLRMEVFRSIAEGETKSYFEEVVRKVEASGHLWHAEEVMEKIACFLSDDSAFLSHSHLLVINLLHSCSEAGLLDKEQKKNISAALKKQIDLLETRISNIWFADNLEQIHPLLSESLRLLALFYLLADRNEESDIRIISARICRYLSRLPSAYSEVLKNKAYTLLAGETALNGRIRWDDIRDFDEMRFLERIVLFNPDEDVSSNLPEPDSKWAQCHNKTNTLTLDHNGFSLSPLFPHDMSSWKGRKDKASVLNDRFFVASFSKLPVAFDDCKGLKNLRLYWKQLEEDFPTAYLGSVPSIPVSLSSETEKQALADIRQTIPAYPECGRKVTVRVLFVDCEKQRLQMEITDPEYRGMKACLPFSNINACHTLIPGLANLFTEGMQFMARVKQADNRDVKLTLTTSYNEYFHAECMRQRKLTGRVTELFDGKIRWLLSSGATAITKQVHNKYKVGDYYKVWYNGVDVGKLTIGIKVQLRINNPDEEVFLQSIADSLSGFVGSLVKDAIGTQEHAKDLQGLKEKYNPFVIALQNMNLRNSDDEVEALIADSPDGEEEPDSPKAKQSATCSKVDILLARELLYCLDLLTDELDKTDEKFNAFNSLSFLSRFTGDKILSDYYQLCTDFLYQVDQLTEAPCGQRFTRENIGKLSNLLKRMELSGISHYNQRLRYCGQIIRVLEALFTPDPSLTLRAYVQHSNQTVSDLARYLSITLYLRDSDEILQQQAYKNINRLLGLKEAQNRRQSYIPVFFGHEGEQKEFKTSAFIHADKNAEEEQFVVLARVLASFMNTDGGTLYIGVNDCGYLNGLDLELKHTHNDSDVYLRTVHHRTLHYLGKEDDWNRYQEYIRCRLYEYEDGRQVLAFRAAPINEVVMVKGCVYTRSGSSNAIKPISNVPEFIENRSKRVLDSTPRQPEFPTFYSPERQEFIFATSTQQPIPAANNVLPFVDTDVDIASGLLPQIPEKELPAEEVIPLPPEEPIVPTPMITGSLPSTKSGKFHYEIATSALRSNPLQKKGELGYTPKHLFVSIFNNGKIAASPSPKIGVWGEDKGKVLFSYNPDDKEDLLVTVYTDGQVGISNLKQGISIPNTPTAFLNSPDGLFFVSPARKKDYLLLLTKRDEEVRYRLILIDGFNKSMGIQPLKTVVLEPDKGLFIYAEIIPFEQIKNISEEKLSLDDFDRYNAGRNWKRSGFEQDVKFISQLCRFSG